MLARWAKHKESTSRLFDRIAGSKKIRKEKRSRPTDIFTFPSTWSHTLIPRCSDFIM